MRSYKQILLLLLAAVLILGCIPAGTVFATADNEPVTRAQWLQSLVDTFGYEIDPDVVPDDFYPDLNSEDEYYEAVQTAVYYGLVDLLPNSEFRPNDPATREFAAYTLNTCMGYLPEAEAYSYSDTVTYPGDIQVAVERGWFDLVGGAFLPEQPITAAERDVMLADAAAYVEAFTIGSDVEQEYVFKDGVVEITEPAQIETADGQTVITIVNCSQTLNTGDIFVIYQDGLAIPYKAESVSVQANRTVITAGDAFFEDAFEDMNVRMATNANPANFYTAEDAELIFIEESTGEEYSQAAVVQALARGSVSKYIPKYSKTLNLGDGMKLKLEVELDNTNVSYDVQLSKGIAAVWLDTDAEVTGKLSCDISKLVKEDLEIYIGGYEVPGVGGLKIVVKFDAKGSISVVKKFHMKAGIKIDVDHVSFLKWKTKKEQIFSVTDRGSTMNAEISAKVCLEAKFGLYGKAMPLKGYFYGEAGFAAKVKYTTYEEITGSCTHFAAYLYAKYGIKVEYDLLGFENELDWENEIYKESNSPVKVSYHYEDGTQVSSCTRKDLSGTSTGDPSKIGDTGYHTRPGSSYSGSGMSSGTSSKGYNKNNEPIIIYKYSLDEDNKATITSYSGTATSLTIPLKLDGYDVVAIGDNAFKKQTGLRTIIMQDNILTIGNSAFESCSGLRNITLSESLTSIGDSAFRYCSGLKTIVVPDSVTTIGKYAFANTGLVSMILSKNLEFLGERVLAYAEDLTSLTIPKTLTGVGSWYSSTGALTDSHLTELIFEEGTTAILTNMATGAGYLASVTIPDSVTSIGDYAFQRCGSLKSIHIPDSVTHIGDYAFADTGLTSLTLPNRLEFLGERFLKNAANLTSLTIPKSLTGAGSYYDSAGPLTDSHLTELIFEEGTTAILKNMATGAGHLVTVTIPDTVTSINSYAFDRCYSLKNINIPDTVTAIGDYAFRDCSSLEAITIPNSVTHIGDWAFARSGLTSLTLPNRLEFLGERFLSDAADLTSLTIPKSLTGIGSYYGSTGPLMDSHLTELIFEEGTKSILPRMAMGASYLVTVTIPDSVTSINEYAFKGCTSLKNITIPETVVTLGNEAFLNCASLESITIPDRVTAIGDDMFNGCSQLVSATIPDSVTSIGVATFADCSSLKEVTLPSNLKVITSSMFEGCAALEQITIPETVTLIQGYAFKNCISLNQLVLPEHITEIKEFAIENCDALTAITIPESVKKLGEGVFYDCDGLTDITIPAGVTTLGNRAFYDCDALTDVKLGTGITEIPASAFEHCDVLESIIIPYRVTAIRDYAFKDCIAFRSVTIPSATESISAKAFSYLDKLTIYGLSGSYAETYATEQYISFVHQEVAATSVKLSETTLTMNNGAATQLFLTVEPGNFTDSVSWKSGDTAVVTVNDNGEVKAVGIGTATIKVTVGNVSASCTVTVIQPVTSVRLNASKQTLEALATYQLTATVNPSNATDGTLVWSSSDPAVATVDKTGLVTAIAKGTATITATAADGSNCSASCTITVSNNGYAVTDPTQMESPHNYPNSCTDFWIYTLEGAEKLAVTFDEQTMIEQGFDYLYIYGLENGKYVEVGKYTGAELAGATVELLGDTVKIQLVSDDSGNEWGFKVTQIKDIPLHTHSYEAVVTNPTCTEDGYTTYTCSCGDSYVTDETAALGHNWGKWTVSKKPTCTKDGEEKRTCSRCDEAETRKVEATGHDYEAVVTDPSCTEGGYTTYTCSCGDSYVTDETDALGHDWGKWTVSKKPTCTKDGEEKRTCSRCDETETRNIDATGHEYEAVVTDPTCTEGGYTTHTCKNCGDSYVTDEVPALGHNFGDWYVTKEATEEAEGEEQRDCSRCDKSETRSIPKLDHVHDYTSVVTDPTCTEGGYTTYTCSCGDSYVTDEVPALGHDYEDGSCNRCGETDPDYKEPVENPFTDVKESDYFLEPVLWAVDNGITAGTGNGKFSPEDTCTRAQVVTFLWRACGKPAPKLIFNPFNDVTPADYFYDAVLWAVENGITSGTGNGKFSPDDPCTRGQVVTFLWRAMDKVEPESDENPFVDVKEADYFYQPVLWAVENKITAGTGNGKFSPEDPCTRGQVVTFLYRTMKDQ